MKTIGLLGGMSYQSSMHYYEIINELINVKLGGLHSAKIVMYSVEFNQIARFQKNAQWDKAGEILGEASKNIQNAGADFLVICTNTMHKVAPVIEKYIDIPILHIADTTAKVLKQNGIKKVGLLGTSFTMEQSFYKNRISEKFGIDVIVPSSDDIKIVNDIIFNELCFGKIKQTSKDEYLRIIDDLARKGVDGVILGCTEIGMLINQNDTDIRLFDTTLIHAKEAALKALD